MCHRIPRTRAQDGQVLAFFAFGFLAIVAGTAFVVDGGNIYSNHRISQNATDAAAQAGAMVLAQRLGGPTRTDEAVRRAVDGVLTAMEMDVRQLGGGLYRSDGVPVGTTVGSMATDAEPPSERRLAWRSRVNDRSERSSLAPWASTNSSLQRSDCYHRIRCSPIGHHGATGHTARDDRDVRRPEQSGSNQRQVGYKHPPQGAALQEWPGQRGLARLDATERWRK